MASEAADTLRRQRSFKGNREDRRRLVDSFDAADPEIWNAWRKKLRHRRPNLSGANLEAVDLREHDLRGAILTGSRLYFAQLRAGDLRGADFRRAVLSAADLSYADLRGANFRDAGLSNATLTEADLRRAILRDADLQRAVLTGARLQGADLRGAAVNGISVWDIQTDRTTRQKGLVLFEGPGDPAEWLGQRPPMSYPHITVDDVEVAHFMSLVVGNEKITSIFNASTSKTVLLLGRFTPKQKLVLDAASDKLRELGYAPVVFDFDAPRDRDLIETITTLARLSSFVIADLTAPRSTPLESHAIIPDLALPFAPIIRQGERPFSMFGDLQRKYDWVLPTVTYRDEKDLARHLQDGIVRPAKRLLSRLRRERSRRIEPIPIRRVARHAPR